MMQLNLRRPTKGGGLNPNLTSASKCSMDLNVGYKTFGQKKSYEKNLQGTVPRLQPQSIIHKAKKKVDILEFIKIKLLTV